MTGSNRRPSACKADALPAELILHLMVTRTGFEPVYACVKGMCVKPLHQRACSVPTSLVYQVCRFLSNVFLFFSKLFFVFQIWHSISLSFSLFCVNIFFKKILLLSYMILIHKRQCINI